MLMGARASRLGGIPVLACMLWDMTSRVEEFQVVPSVCDRPHTPFKVVGVCCVICIVREVKSPPPSSTALIPSLLRSSVPLPNRCPRAMTTVGQIECRLPWPHSVALPPRCMDKYSRVQGLLMRLEFTVHVLEDSHAVYRCKTLPIRRLKESRRNGVPSVPVVMAGTHLSSCAWTGVVAWAAFRACSRAEAR